MLSRAEARKLLGQSGEDAAARLLQAKGLGIIARNWRKGSLELDLVCRDGGTLVFVEVRTRRAGGMLTPAESLTPSKRRSFERAARAYLQANDLWDSPCRFDLVCAEARSINPPFDLQLEHFINVDL
ncbi:MAG: YraN family protein [Desulfovibrionaceae bacterium]|nr:YraN family protein [Desulfovibrionaceae bacterium]